MNPLVSGGVYPRHWTAGIKPAARALSSPLVVLVLLLHFGACQSAAPAEPADDEPYLPGLVASFQDDKGHAAVRLDHQLAFHWGEAPPDPRVAAGGFHATWRGQILITTRGNHRFALFGTGEVELKVAGQVIVPKQTLEKAWQESVAVPLSADFQSIELSFRRTAKDPQLLVLWSGPDFGMEPIPARFLFHPREQRIESDFARGELLSRVLRCERCHGEASSLPPAPALDRVAGDLSRDWLIHWLAAGEQARPAPGGQGEQAEPLSPRRMPALGLSEAQAEAISDWLLTEREPRRRAAAPVREEKPRPKPAKSGPAKPNPNAQTGEKLFLTLGCLACHTWRDLGASGWLGGGDLTHIADKRPADFFAAWLADPTQLNRDHRMPVFTLSDDEQTSLAMFLAGQRSEETRLAPKVRASAERRAEGRKLVEQFHCGNCHRLPDSHGDAGLRTTRLAPRLDEHSRWDPSCLGAPDPVKPRPGYRLTDRDARALRLYYATSRPVLDGRPNRRAGRLVLAENNCLACHAREGTREAIPLLPPLLSEKLTAVGKRYPDLAPLIPALTPPALNSVGDKLTDAALLEAVSRRAEPHRPYLQVRMPRFPLSDDDLQALTRHLVTTDRIPDRPERGKPPVDSAQKDRYALAGGRLVSSDGFGCTSCHQVGTALPSTTQLNARGPDLSQLDRRIRRPWFDRWVRNPARIVPQMEMPAVQIPVAGVLHEKVEDQLDAVWHVLNIPGFEPPPPNPIRTFRHSGSHAGAPPLLVTDMLQNGEQTILRPFLVGLANRHNVLFDLEAGGLARWLVGDVAYQRTKGKAWFWDLGGTTVLETGLATPDLSLAAGGQELSAVPQGQFVTEADAWQSEGTGAVLNYRLVFAIPVASGGEPKRVTLAVRRRWLPSPSGFTQELVVGPAPAGARLRLRVVSPQAAVRATRSADGRTLQLGDRFGSRIVLGEPADASFLEDRTGVLLSAGAKGMIHVLLHYQSNVPVDRFPEPPVTPPTARKGEPVEVAPGFTGERLPLPPEIMPTGLSWRPDGRLVFCTLKGQVFEASAADPTGPEDHLRLLADGLPAPYGVHAGPDYVDVSVKFAVLRLRDLTGSPVEAIASGWGYSSDYHDWVVGLPQNDRGEYFVGIPCQQDKRSPAAAHFHGNVLRLTPRRPTADNPRLFGLEPISAGHRFPMGLALDRSGELFVTDNQGNYKPFNELNHVRTGAHFGFINTLDRDRPAPPRTPSAIDIPHPWTRSVNGICFLDTPKKVRARLGRDLFGPLEGHLIGCEYTTHQLVRMTLQRVGGTFQGASYPLSIPPRDPQRGFLGPLVCAVSPRGELYVGSILDSGWGAGNNIGEIVRVRVEPDRLPCGIAEVRATSDGFTIDFFQPVDRALAGQVDSYAVQSYRREPTPAYGGPDKDRRSEKVTGVTVSADGRRATLRLAEMRPGFVYELRLKNLAPGGADFHPAEAHYTLLSRGA
jgi:hypothetical protein